MWIENNLLSLPLKIPLGNREETSCKDQLYRLCRFTVTNISFELLIPDSMFPLSRVQGTPLIVCVILDLSNNADIDNLKSKGMLEAKLSSLLFYCIDKLTL